MIDHRDGGTIYFAVEKTNQMLPLVIFSKGGNFLPKVGLARAKPLTPKCHGYVPSLPGVPGEPQRCLEGFCGYLDLVYPSEDSKKLQNRLGPKALGWLSDPSAKEVLRVLTPSQVMQVKVLALSAKLAGNVRWQGEEGVPSSLSGFVDCFPCT